MKILATFDARDYEGTTGIYEKYSIRAIIVRDGRLAMQCSQEGEYKIPGGGQEPGENYEQTLIREVKEETGLYVRPESICELGEIIELHRDIFEPDKKFICHSLFFYCDVLDEQDLHKRRIPDNPGIFLNQNIPVIDFLRRRPF